jgi:hypothetical protein
MKSYLADYASRVVLAQSSAWVRGRASPSAPLSGCQQVGLREGRRPRSGCSRWRHCFVRQGQWEGPVGEQLGNWSGHGVEAVDAGSEVDDEDAVGSQVLVALFVVVGMDQRGGGGAADVRERSVPCSQQGRPTGCRCRRRCGLHARPLRSVGGHRPVCTDARCMLLWSSLRDICWRGMCFAPRCSSNLRRGSHSCWVDSSRTRECMTTRRRLCTCTVR